MELAQQIQIEVTNLNKMAQILHQYEQVGGLRNQMIIQLRMMFPEIEKALNQMFEMRADMRKLMPNNQIPK